MHKKYIYFLAIYKFTSRFFLLSRLTISEDEYLIVAQRNKLIHHIYIKTYIYLFIYKKTLKLVHNIICCFSLLYTKMCLVSSSHPSISNNNKAQGAQDQTRRLVCSASINIQSLCTPATLAARYRSLTSARWQPYPYRRYRSRAAF